jgi:hypothetical protein
MKRGECVAATNSYNRKDIPVLVLSLVFIWLSRFDELQPNAATGNEGIQNYLLSLISLPPISNSFLNSIIYSFIIRDGRFLRGFNTKDKKIDWIVL